MRERKRQRVEAVSPEVRSRVDAVLARLGVDAMPRGERAGLLMPALTLLQEEGDIDGDALAALARAVGVTEGRVFSAATFYSSFRLTGQVRRRRPPSLDAVLEAVLGAERAPASMRSTGVTAPDGSPGGALRRCGRIDPRNIDDYLADDGYAALRVARAMAPAEVTATISAARLRGRGGAGFPTGSKWARVAGAANGPPALICNAAEGDPGAFGDMALLQSDPHSIIEGLAIAAHAVGAPVGTIYVRTEYEEAIETLRCAIRQARERGILGDGFDAEVFEGGGRYVCGDETALLNSMEGKPGRPRLRPPLPADSGLWERPTLIDNVKTLALVTLVLRWGAPWFAEMGTAGSTGPAILAISGHVREPGVVEVPMGVTLRAVIDDLAGGAAGGRRIKAVQTGGPLGGVAPEPLLDTPVCFDAMGAIGAPLGAGGLIVMDDETCMVAASRAFAEFAAAESCGHCAPCRQGTQQVLHILRAMVQGKGRAGDLELLSLLAKGMHRGSFCAFGRSGASVAISALTRFRSEFEQHIAGARCPAGWCMAEEA